AFVAFASYDAALAGLLAFERAFGEMLSAFEFMSAAAVGCVAAAYPASTGSSGSASQRLLRASTSAASAPR
ncbi:hypothetical protein LAN30_24500, partial [Mycobacterium tuberculosis]|nr:hypothetical protein [Mycobacterium tuberculosis]